MSTASAGAAKHARARGGRGHKTSTATHVANLAFVGVAFGATALTSVKIAPPGLAHAMVISLGLSVACAAIIQLFKHFHHTGPRPLDFVIAATLTLASVVLIAMYMPRHERWVVTDPQEHQWGVGLNLKDESLTEYGRKKVAQNPGITPEGLMDGLAAWSREGVRSIWTEESVDAAQSTLVWMYLGGLACLNVGLGFFRLGVEPRGPDLELSGEIGATGLIEVLKG